MKRYDADHFGKSGDLIALVERTIPRAMIIDNSVCPRPEHPRPQLAREKWLCINGLWTYSFDFGKSGKERGFHLSNGFDDPIVVPFCPESELSGVAYKDFVENMWYHRFLRVPQEWAEMRVLLHFGAIDYEAEIFIDGLFICRHWGGSSSFSIDITPVVLFGHEHNLVVHVHDDNRTGEQASGKQSIDYTSAGCLYSRVTGIWQSVWLEAVPSISLETVQLIPGKNHEACLWVIPTFNRTSRDYEFSIDIKDAEGRLAGSASSPVMNGSPIKVPVENPRFWSLEDPFLYDLSLTIGENGEEPIDSVSSYAGLRTVQVHGNQIYLNDEPVYLRLVLDQGYYPDGIWTAPSDDALRKDIELGLAAGFNGARLHQKVFEERFHYWADKLGYLTWAESPNWGMDLKKDMAARNFISEWREIVVRDRNHPSIVAWTVLNETWDLTDRRRHRRLHLDAYDVTRSMDPTRPINGASGGCQVRTDLYCVHIYEQDPSLLHDSLKPGSDGKVFRTLGDEEVEYEGQPYIVDEFGGIRWIADPHRIETFSWGYGRDPNSMEEFYHRLEGQILAIVNVEVVTGFCYTQLTDVEQEQNGIYHYDRSPKFDMNRIREIIQRESGDDEDHLKSMALVLKS